MWASEPAAHTKDTLTLSTIKRDEDIGVGNPLLPAVYATRKTIVRSALTKWPMASASEDRAVEMVKDVAKLKRTFPHIPDGVLENEHEATRLELHGPWTRTRDEAAVMKIAGAAKLGPMADVSIETWRPPHVSPMEPCSSAGLTAKRCHVAVVLRTTWAGTALATTRDHAVAHMVADMAVALAGAWDVEALRPDPVWTWAVKGREFY